jgi:predicted N-acetyltransferase YhbS
VDHFASHACGKIIQLDHDVTRKPVPTFRHHGLGGWHIREARPGDEPALVAIDRRATALLASAGLPELLGAGAPGAEEFREAARQCAVLVAADGGDEPLGFAIARPIDGMLHLCELAVDPAHGRCGIGSALVRAVIERAAGMGLAGVSLTTFRHVPFNAPFYARLGFSELRPQDATAGLLAAFRAEIPEGIASSTRLIMVLRHEGDSDEA